MHTLQRFILHRARLSAAFSIGFIVALALPDSMSLLTRCLVAWNVAVWLYLILMLELMIRANHVQVCKIAQQEDKSALVVLSIMSVAAVASLAAIIFELLSVKELPTGLQLFHYMLTTSTVVGSWFLLGIMYTFHYAHLFYSAPADRRPLFFPENEPNPNYWDFLYFSFNIAVAVQTSDINIMSRTMRKTVLAQSLLSFIFNVAILGFSVNIAAGLVGA